MSTNVMKDFIHDIRTDRKREQAAYKDKGYIVNSGYICLSNVEVICDNDKYSFNVQADRNEIKFFLSNDKANIYLSLYDIYDLIRELPSRIRTLYKMAFKYHVLNNVNTECYFLYKGIRYELSPCVEIKKAKINLEKIGLTTDFAQLYFLIHLIQNKSNSMFERSTDEEKKANINGIYRLYSVLLSKRSSSEILCNKGWVWDSKLKKYVLEAKPKNENDVKWIDKYYLTESEYATILGIKKP